MSAGILLPPRGLLVPPREIVLPSPRQMLSVVGRALGFMGGVGGGGSYRYLRLQVNSTGQGSFTEIRNLRFKVGGTSYPTSNMTTNSAPSPLVALASSEYSGSYQAFNAFDGNAASFGWSNVSGLPAWVQIDLGSGNGITPDAVVIAPPDSGGASSQAPSTFDILGSNTGSFSGEEATLYTGSPGTSGWTAATDRTFTF